MEYLLILIALLVISLILEWVYHIKLYDSRKERIIIPLIFFAIGVAWDHLAAYRQHWTFEGPGL
ncbi:hypothetical protein KY325_01850, partial [Candidatus Woesearchaeota archaeon]|nr:hypothetical protein [Candidatus Woesearchaeota archaeon]